MANLVKAYCTNYKIPKEKEFIPGDIIVFKKKINTCYRIKIVEKLYIVNLNRDPIFISTKCQLCNRFHIKQIQYKNNLGNHWRKYREKYFYNLNLPFTNSECYPISDF